MQVPQTRDTEQGNKPTSRHVLPSKLSSIHQLVAYTQLTTNPSPDAHSKNVLVYCTLAAVHMTTERCAESVSYSACTRVLCVSAQCNTMHM